MKQILSILLLISVFTFAKAQGNLQFNQVKYIKLSYVTPNNNSYQGYDQVITVPPGKVWKIESVIGSAQGNSNYVSPTTTVTLDGVVLSFYSSSSNGYQAAPLPIWLPEGSYTLSLVSSASLTTGTTITGRVSAIEFNIVP